MSDRREFLRQTAAAVAGLNVTTFQITAQPRAAAMPTPRAAALMAAFGLKFSIFNAGMGLVANPELAIAVSNAGGLGAIGTGARLSVSTAPAAPADIVRQNVARTRAGTTRPFAINYLLAFDPVTLPIALDAGAPVIQFAWGIPSAESVAAIRRAGARMGIQISSAAGARRALDVGGGGIAS